MRSSCSTSEAPISLQRGVRQLFVDDAIIAQRHNVARRLHQPIKHLANPILAPARPWEGTMTVLYGTVLRDEEEGLFKMWYQAFDPPPQRLEDQPRSRRTCYAISHDGVHWERPELGILSYEGSRRNNIVFNHEIQPYYGEIHNVIKDTDDPDPQRRYKMTLCSGAGVPHPGSYFSACSPDGIHWRPSPEPIITYPGQTPDISHLIKDPISGKYRLYCRIIAKRPEVAARDPAGCCGRAVGLMESEDFVRWSVPEPVFMVDLDDPPGSDAHRMMVIPYERMYIGLLELYLGIGPCTEIRIQLTSSRDGRNWQRVADRATFLPAGTAGDWDPHFTTFSDIPCLVGDELWFYYSARRYWENRVVDPARPGVVLPCSGAIGLAKLRRDGFCSMGADCGGGSLTTVPLRLPPGELHLNVKSNFGQVRVTVLDEAGHPLPSAEARVSADSCDAAVHFPAGSGLHAYSSRPVRLHFELRNALLYAFWVE